MKVSGLDHRFSPPHQKRGDASFPWIPPMRSGPRRRGTPRVRLSRTLPPLGTLLVLFAAVSVLAVSPASAAYTGQGSESYEWSNSAVLCVFDGSLPSVTVSAVNLNNTGISAAMEQVSEISPLGVSVATAVVSSSDWEPDNFSSAQSYVMNYSQFVSVTNATDASHILGQAWISVSFSLNRTSPIASLADVVDIELSVQEWPWQSASDSLALIVPVWSANSTSEHVVVGPATSPRVESVRNSNGQVLEYFEAGATATTGTGVVVPVSSETTISHGIATATLSLGRGAGGASAIFYQATMGITPSTRVLGLPLYDYLAVAGGAGLVALVVGVGARRVRQQPSDLTYVEEAK
jgi:hypothetical protein